MSQQTTTVLIPGRSAITGIPGSKTVQQIISMYGSEIPSLRNMDGSVEVVGDETRVSFRHRTGTKG